ncbi:putative AT-hook motif nuclear-localized protein [Dioscorea sansibarensis]
MSSSFSLSCFLVHSFVGSKVWIFFVFLLLLLLLFLFFFLSFFFFYLYFFLLSIGFYGLLMRLLKVMERKQAMNVSSQGSKAVAEVGSGLRGATRRKRGRPRKYVPGVTSNYDAAAAAMDAVPLPRRGTRRLPGSGSKQQLSYPGNWLTGPVRMGLMTTFMIIIEVGENIAEKIISFAEEGPKHLCILSVNGSVSSATLRRPSVAGGVVTYEGTKLDILSLSGSLMLDEDGASVTGMDGLNITLSSPDGRVIGGCVGDVLIAATPVQVKPLDQ